MRTSKLLEFSLLATLPAVVFCGEVAAPVEEPNSDANMEAGIHNLLVKIKASLRPLKGGTFEMGDWGNEQGVPYNFDAHSRPLHKVTLDGFSMMAYKVTFEDFDIFTDATGKERIHMSQHDREERAAKRPAGVSWHGAKAYCGWLANMTKLPFDLPTEAQWEYAARSGGKKVLFATDNGKIERGRNFPEKWKSGEKEPPIADVGSYAPNPAGLYGMSEDTGEWVNDWFREDYYKISPKKNPGGPPTGTKKVMRGSVGGAAEIAAMVFMRTEAIPQPMESTYPNGISNGEVLVPLPGYSGYRSHNFRCIVNRSIDRPQAE
jgi:formylglycine-generating enzyme required for sulfatase activity